jgi:type IV pilus assembly protein PilE
LYCRSPFAVRRSPFAVIFNLTRTKFHRLKNSAFTLIELLVVVLIIGILAAIALPYYNAAVDKSRASQALANINTLFSAAQMHRLATGEKPTSTDQLDISFPSDTNFDFVVYEGGVAAVPKSGKNPAITIYKLYTDSQHLIDFQYPMLCQAPKTDARAQKTCLALGFEPYGKETTNSIYYHF